MTHRLTTSVRKADRILKNVHLTRNFNIFAQIQPKCLDLRRFLSQLNSHPVKGFDKPFNQNNGNKSGACAARGIGGDRNSSSLSGGADGREGDEKKSKVGPGSGGENKSQVFSSIAGILGVCRVYLNHKGVVVDNFLGRRTHLTQLVNAAKSTDPQVQYAAVNSLRKLLTSGRNPPVDLLVSCNILPTLVDCLNSQNPSLQFDALLAMTKIVEGRSEQAQTVVQMIIDSGVLAKLVQLLGHGEVKIQAHALRAVDNIIKYGNKEQKEHLIEVGVIPPLCNFLNSKDSETVRIVLLGIHNILAEMSGNQGKICALIKECCGWDKIKTLQNHENMEISKIAHDIIQIKFFLMMFGKTLM